MFKTSQEEMICIMIIFYTIITTIHTLPTFQVEFETFKIISRRKINEINIESPDNSRKLSLKNPQNTFHSQILQDKIVSELYKSDAVTNRKRVFVEAGAYDGETWSNTLSLERFDNWTGLLIEPSLENYKILKSKNRNSFSLNACLKGNNIRNQHEKRHTQFVEAGPFSLTLNSTNFTNGLTNVTCFSLEEILKRFFAILRPSEKIIDYLSLDIEGDERGVLETFLWSNSSFRINLMSIEYNQDRDLYKWILDYMKKFDYEEIFVDDKWYQDVYLAHKSIIPYLNRIHSRVSQLV